MSDVWARPLRENRAAVDTFIEVVAATPSDVWSRTPAPDRWSPGQVAAHVVLTYEYLLAELGGGAPLRIRTPPLMRVLLRTFLLPHMLYHRTLPIRVRAPKEVRPDSVGLAQQEVEERIRAIADRLERELSQSERQFLTHPFLGRLTLPKAVRFIAVHTEHHTRQIAAARH